MASVSHQTIDSTVEVPSSVVASLIATNGVVVVLALASWSAPCKQIRSSFTQMTPSSSSSSSPLLVVYLDVDSCDEVEEAALDLGLSSIPSCRVYCRGQAVGCGPLSEGSVTVPACQALIAACALPPSGSSMDVAEQTDMVRRAYAATATGTQSCCVSVDSTLLGYTTADLIKAGASSNLGVGCGNPLSFAALKPGEAVLDLGSGAGIDVFLASRQVGPRGLAIGVDMTAEMVSLSRANLKLQPPEVRACASFRLGEIEHLPVGDSLLDCAISNCVVNLSSDKGQVFKELYRVLKGGGRLALCDVVECGKGAMPEELRTANALAC